MKRFTTVLIALLAASSIFLHGMNENTNDKVEMNLDTSTEYTTIKVATKVPNGIKKTVINELSYPKKAKDKQLEGQVYLRLTVDGQSNLKIVDLNATSPYLGKYVREQLASTYIKKPGCKPGQVYVMKINFDLLQ